MKALESAPERYDKGINWLGWGKLEKVRTHIVDLVEKEGNYILEIGVGMGIKALLLAERGFQVIGIDHSPKMLAQVQKMIKPPPKKKASKKSPYKQF
ncbi:MAG: class I SAM-dependent methyltransferase [Promethearchaeota archaeon]